MDEGFLVVEEAMKQDQDGGRERPLELGK